ncbi:hypothetical protein PoB_004493100 [Plakobranchus ocellatus]|uniref:Uncharacterized protein n=1 Tax=Plakobranchus ocellatus TaxID=259542 RepID=A0AAV4BDD5_9GAST|nr:hypothetical protein PoB_004493100 [Plakobranchus ocellatus]
MFPHRQCADLNGLRGSTGCRWNDDWRVWNKDENKYKYMDDWPINFVKTSKSDERYGFNDDAGVISQLRLAHWQNTCGGKGLMDKGCRDYRHPRQDYLYSKEGAKGGFGKDMKVLEAGFDHTYGGYSVSHHIVSGLSPDRHANDVTVRPPYSMFGVHPDFERKANGMYPYNYFANMNITYYSTVEWLIASPAPS